MGGAEPTALKVAEVSVEGASAGMVQITVNPELPSVMMAAKKNLGYHRLGRGRGSA